MPTLQNPDSYTRLHKQLISFYAKCQFFGYAYNLFDQIPKPDSVSWSSIISGYVQNGFCEKAILEFGEMHKSGVECTEFSFSSVLKACSVMKDLNRGKQIHGVVIRTGLSREFRIRSLQHSPMTMEEVLRVLVSKSKLEGEDAIRKSVLALNALAGIAIINGDISQAISLYREALTLAEGHWPDFQLDPPMNMHIHLNLVEIFADSADSLDQIQSMEC